MDTILNQINLSNEELDKFHFTESLSSWIPEAVKSQLGLIQKTYLQFLKFFQNTTVGNEIGNIEFYRHGEIIRSEKMFLTSSFFGKTRLKGFFTLVGHEGKRNKHLCQLIDKTFGNGFDIGDPVKLEEVPAPIVNLALSIYPATTRENLIILKSNKEHEHSSRYFARGEYTYKDSSGEGFVSMMISIEIEKNE